MSIEVTMCLTFLQIVEDERAMAKSEGPSTFRATEIDVGVRCVVLQDSSHTAAQLRINDILPNPSARRRLGRKRSGDIAAKLEAMLP